VRANALIDACLPPLPPDGIILPDELGDADSIDG
jgi:hypothetical protein